MAISPRIKIHAMQPWDIVSADGEQSCIIKGQRTCHQHPASASISQVTHRFNMMLPTLSVFVFSLPLLANGQSGFIPPHNHVNPDWKITDNKISWTENGFSKTMACPSPSLIMQVNHENTYYGCCPKGQTFFGASDVTGFHCCSEGHELSGSPENGYECCPTDKGWDGKGCNIDKHPVPKCEGGQIPDGHGGCKCPPGKRLTKDGCVPDPCSSGIMTGNLPHSCHPWFLSPCVYRVLLTGSL